MKMGTMRAALVLARAENMVDGQDPMVVMNRCSLGQLNAAVHLDIEVNGGKGPRPSQREATCAPRGTEPVEAWPLLLTMYVSLQPRPLRDAARMWPCYVFARRFRDDHEALTGFLEKVSDRRLNFEVTVVREQGR
jgi:hypothetical protein